MEGKVFENTSYSASGQRERRVMRRLALAIAIMVSVALMVSACNEADAPPGPNDACARKVFPVFNPKIFDQCVAVCKQCEKGVTVTCTTACKLRGAQ
jgi:hypothetical protein